ncbi:MAG: TonB family protein [Formivibrio sp.]|nr:TonB family protein [Formivibrio sp.]
MDREQRFFSTAVLVSALAHAIIIGGIRFTMPTPKRIPAVEPMEIVLVNQKTRLAPVKHEVLAQVNQDGGGNTDAKQRAKSPLPAAQHDPVLEQKLEQQKQLEEKALKLMTRIKSDATLSSTDKVDPSQAESKGLDPEQLKQQLREAGIAAQIGKDYNAYQERPRKAFIGVRARQTSVALWADSWAQKIERVGTYAYPVDAHGNKLRGRLRVTAEINSDGGIIKSQVEQSSGNRELDQAALRILQLASPFSKLPDDMVDDTGKPATVLVITRTWSFGRDNALGLD